MADQEKKKKEDPTEAPLDDDSFSLDLEDFDLGEEDLEPTAALSDNDEVIELDSDLEDMVASTSDDLEDDFLDIDLDSDLNLTEEELPPGPKPIDPTPIVSEEDLELEFDEDIQDLDLELESIITNKESVFATRAKAKQSQTSVSASVPPIEEEEEIVIEEPEAVQKEAPTAARTEEESDSTPDIDTDLNYEPEESLSEPFSSDIDEEGPLALSLEELDNIAGDAEEEPVSSLEAAPAEDAESEENELGLDLDESEIDTELEFDEEGVPALDLDDTSEAPMEPSDLEEPEIEHEPSAEPEPPTPKEPAKNDRILDPEEEELFGGVKEDENLTLSDDELGNILGSGDGVSFEESLEYTEEAPVAEESSTEESIVDVNEESVPESMDSEEEDGPITLSLDELDEISESAVEADPTSSLQEFGAEDTEETEDESETEDLEEELPDLEWEPEDHGEAESETISLAEDEPEATELSESHDPVEDDSTSPTMEEDLSEEESITLSDDELGNILGDDEPVSDPESEPVSEPVAETEIEEELSPTLEEEEDSEPTLAENLFAEEDEDDSPIALSMEELESIEAISEEEAPAEPEDSEAPTVEDHDEELVDSMDRNPLPYEETEAEEDESISLSMEELENITGDEIPKTAEALSDEDSEIELVEDILGDSLPGEDLEDIGELPVEAPVSGLVGAGSEESASQPEDIATEDSEEKKIATLADDGSPGVLVDLDDYALEGKLSPLEDLRASQIPLAEEPPVEEKSEPSADKQDAGDGLDASERKMVLSYLDNLLGNLPDNVIKDFSKSQYFELYKKMMKELGL